MYPYNGWPYTNMHELNLDWMVTIVRRAEDTMNKLSETINGIVDDRFHEFEDLFERYDEQLRVLEEKLQAEVDNAIRDMDEELVRMQAEIAAGLRDIDERMSRLEAELNERIEAALRDFTADLERQLREMKAEIDALIADNNEWKEEWESKNQQWLDSALENFKNSLPDVQQVLVISPVSGHLVTITQALKDVYESVNFLALKAEEYDRLGITAEKYDNYMMNYIPKGLTAYEYDFLGKYYLVIMAHPELYARHPITGESTWWEYLVQFNTTLAGISGMLGAEDYDGLQLLAEEYDDLQLVAEDYDFYGCERIGGADGESYKRENC